MMKILRILLLVFFFGPLSSIVSSDWQLGPFERVDEANPIISPLPNSVFDCPLQHREVRWEADHTFNPAAVVRDGKVYVMYRAEDDYATGIGYHTSRIGLAESSDGIHFERRKAPVLFPDNDGQSRHEFPGGCEDPRVVETEDGIYVMMYTQWNRKTALLSVATSEDLVHWKKYGYAFEGKWPRKWSKSGSIVCRQEGDKLIATKIQGKYWMYWGEGIFVATSDDLISWQPLLDRAGNPLAVLSSRPGKFDSALVEAGPPAIITEDGILLLYNGKNSHEKGDPNIFRGGYSAGQVLFDPSDPTKIKAQADDCFLTPQRPYEMKGQYKEGTVFIEGLVHFQGQWMLYYGTADSAVGVALVK